VSPSKKSKSRKEFSPNAETKPIQDLKKSGIGFAFLRILVLAIVIGITVYIYSIRQRVDDFAAYGYPGIFLVMLMANATVIIPAPGVAVVFAMGDIFNPIFVALAAGTGGAIGELSGYMAGFSGQAVIENRKWYDKVTVWMKKYGGITVLVLAFIPNPLFDIAGMVAGALKMPVWKYLLFSWPGKTAKMIIFALGGATILGWFGL